MPPFEHTIRVRYNECDPQNVVFNAHYFMYFDLAITELWRTSYGSYQAMIDAGTDVMVAEARARYLAPARFDDLLNIAIEISRLGTTSMTSDLTVSCDGTLVTEGQLRHVFIDLATQTKREIPDDIRSALEPYSA